MMECETCGTLLIACITCGKEFAPSQSRHKYCSKVCYWRRDSIPINFTPEFKSRIISKVKNRIGSILSTKTTSKTVLIEMGRHAPRRSSRWDDKKDLSNYELGRLYSITEGIFEDMGGLFFASARKTGKKYKWYNGEREK